MLIYSLFILGFVLLIKGADIMVDGASSIARKLNISDMVIGLTVLSVGTSAPELFVNLFAVTKGTTDLTIGNIIGSNIANIFLILGTTAVICPIMVTKNTAWKEVPLSLLAAICVAVLANDMLLDNMNQSVLSRIDGIILLFFFIIFMYYLASIMKQAPIEKIFDTESMSWFKSIAFILLGLISLALGSDWIVDGATRIARNFGISEKIIGLSMVAFGTSLPELAASVSAARKNKVDLAVGNVIGSNVFNIFLILGLSAVIRPLPFDPVPFLTSMNFDVFMAVLANLVIFIFMLTGGKHRLDRWEGGVMILIYVLYIIYLYIM